MSQPIDEWLKGVDRARAQGQIPPILPTSWIERMRDDIPAEYSDWVVLPKEAFVSLVSEAVLSVEPGTARDWRQGVAYAQDAPKDLVVIDPLVAQDVIEAVLAGRRVVAASLADDEDPAFREFVMGRSEP